MILSPWRVLSWFLAIVAIGLPLAAVVFFFMAIAGDPGTCEAENRPITTSPEQAATFQERWNQLNSVLALGGATSITVSENEMTSRAEAWIEEQDVPVSNLVICFSMEGGAASGQVDVPFFPVDVDVLIRGTVDMTGEKLEVNIEEIKIGSLPGPLTNLVENFINELIDDQENLLGLDHDYGIEFTDGRATINGTP